MIKLPDIKCLTAESISTAFTEEELGEVIAYLELVANKVIIPGPEMFALGINPIIYNEYECFAVQSRIALAIQKMNP